MLFPICSVPKTTQSSALSLDRTKVIYINYYNSLLIDRRAVSLYTSPLDAEATEHIDFYISIEKVRPLKLAGGSDTAFISSGRQGGTAPHSSSLSLLLIRISETRAERGEGGVKGGDQKACVAVAGEAGSPLKQSHYETHADPLARRGSAVSPRTLGCVSAVPLW